MRALTSLILAAVPICAQAGPLRGEGAALQLRFMRDEGELSPKQVKKRTKPGAAGVGCITGRVKWAGPPPAPGDLLVDRDTPVCELIKDDLSLIVGDDGGVANTFVFLSELTLVSEPDTQNGILEQLNCAYRPHAQVVSAGALVTMRNADPLPASFKATVNETPVFTVDILPGQAPAAPTKLTASGMMTVRSQRNSWQSAVIFVATTGFNDLTDDGGKFVIRDVPVGKYKLAALHEPWGKATTARRIVKPVTVVKNLCTNVDFELNASEN